MSREWCETCQGHYEGSHYDGNGVHLVGAEYGWVGEVDAKVRDLTAENKALKAEVERLRKTVAVKDAANRYFIAERDEARAEVKRLNRILDSEFSSDYGLDDEDTT